MTLTLTYSDNTTQEIRPKEDTTETQAVRGILSITAEPTENSLIEPLSQLAGFKQLRPNWDSYNGLTPTDKAIARASDFLSIVYARLGRFTSMHVLPHKIAPLPDGGTHLNWKRPQAEIEVEFSPDGALSFLFVNKQGGNDESYIEEENAPWWQALVLIEKTLLS